MQIKEISKIIEAFAPLETQEKWDNSGWAVNHGLDIEVNKILLCLSVTEDIINQAQEKNCDMIISHHPLFFVPFEFNKNIPIYSAHTNLDKARGGTTDTLIEALGFDSNSAQKIGDFLRLITLNDEISVKEFANKTKTALNIERLRIVNNKNNQNIKKIAFCAGSGADFLNEVENLGADLFVTGDLKYHTALDSNVIIADVGHFESEHPVLVTIKRLLEDKIEVLIADEKSPFINY